MTRAFCAAAWCAADSKSAVVLVAATTARRVLRSG